MQPYSFFLDLYRIERFFSLTKFEIERKNTFFVLPLKVITWMFYAISFQQIAQHLQRILMNEHFSLVFLLYCLQQRMMASQLWLHQKDLYFITNLITMIFKSETGFLLPSQNWSTYVLKFCSPSLELEAVRKKYKSCSTT